MPLCIKHRTKTPGLLQLEAQSGHQQASQKRAAKRSWNSTMFNPFLQTCQFRGHVSTYVQMCSCVLISKYFNTIIVLHHSHSCAWKMMWSSIKKLKNDIKCQPLLDCRVFPTTNPWKSKGKNSTNGMSPPLTLQNESSQPKLAWVGPFPNQDTGTTSAWGAVWTSSTGFSSEAGCQT